MMTLPSFRARPIVLVPINATYGVGQMLFDAVFKRLADRSRDRASAPLVLYRVSEGLTHRRRTRRHAGEGRYPRLSLLRQREVVDTGLRRHDEGASPKSRSFGDPVLPQWGSQKGLSLPAKLLASPRAGCLVRPTGEAGFVGASGRLLAWMGRGVRAPALSA